MDDETGMSDADKIEFVDDVLRTWGEEAAQELAERYAVDLEALKHAGESIRGEQGLGRDPTGRRGLGTGAG